MPSLAQREEIKRNSDQDPDIDRLKDALQETTSQLSPFYNQTQCNFDTRNNFWPGQDLESGRKKGSPNNPAYPWEDASDIRPFTVDSYIRENKALLVKSLLRGNLTAVPVEGNDIERAKMISQFMKWLLSQSEDIDRQSKILADYQEEKGIGICGVFWDTKVEEVMEDLTLEDVLAINPEDPSIGERLVALILEPETTNEATDIMQEFFPSVKRRKARKMVNDLRKNSITRVGVPQVIENKPIIKAYTMDEDVFFQPNVIDLQDAPYIFHRVFMTPEELRAKINVEGWDEKWVEEVIKTTVGQQPDDIISYSTTLRKKGTRRTLTENIIDNNGGFISVVFAYEKATTEDGVPGVFVTAMHPNVEGWGKSELLDYPKARYPFVAFPREYRTQRLMDSRGLPEICKGFQDEIKVQQDSRVDRTHLSTCPPRRHPLGRKASNWGPGDSLGERRPGEYGFIEAPTGGISDSIEIEQTVRDNMNRMLGRPVAGEEPQHAIDVLQDMVDQWLRNWKKVMDQMWDLHQKFGNDMEFFRVIGSQDAESMQFIRSEGPERVDFYLDYPVINADAAVLFDKLNTMGDIASKLDRSGRFDYDELLSAIASTLDTSYPERFIKPAQVATEEEIRQTQDDLSKIASGQAVNAPANANVQLRLQVIDQYSKGTEDIPATDVQERYQSDENFKARIDKYVEQLQFQETQRRNAVIGALGTEPGNTLPSA